MMLEEGMRAAKCPVVGADDQLQHTAVARRTSIGAAVRQAASDTDVSVA